MIVIYNRLVQHAQILLKFITSKSGKSAGLLLCEIYQGGPEVCLHLKDDHIQELMSIIISKQAQSRAEVNCTLVQALQYIILVSFSVFHREYFHWKGIRI